MSKRKDDSSDARGSKDSSGSLAMELDEEGEGAAKQTRTNKWHCDYCKNEIHDFEEYWVPWWPEYYLTISCIECSREYESEMDAYERAAEKKATEEKTTKKSKCEHGL